LSGRDENANVIIDFINNSKYRYDVCADSTVPSLIIKYETLRKSYVEFVTRGGHIRFITEITKENLSYCKEIMKLVELRHIEGIKGIVRMNEKEFQSNLAVQESKLTSILFRSTVEEVVKVQQCVYDSLWKLAIPAGQKIKEIERMSQQ
jgi:two-component system sensor histidine kinase VicK